MKVLITLPFSEELLSNYSRCTDQLRAEGFQVELDARHRRLSETELIEAWPDVYAHICTGDAITAKALESAGSLKIISRMGVGYDSVDMGAANRLGIAVAITPGANTKAVAEYAFLLMLALGRKILQTDQRVRAGQWATNMGVSPEGKTLGIVGLGNIGKVLATHARNFSMKILAYDEYRDETFASEHSIAYASLETLIKESDFISLHLPLTEKTHDMISEKHFHMMKPNACVVNCARGGIINESALYHALKNKRIQGAALDVFAREPLPEDSPLRTLDNVILSSHTAGMTVECREGVFEMAVQTVLDYHGGRISRGVINAEQLVLRKI